MTTTIGFVAYPGYPPEIGQSIEAATRAHNQCFGPENLCTWRESDIAGRFLTTPIFDHIRDSKCLVADVSLLNFNVTYEVGYAIGQRRRVFLNIIHKGLNQRSGVGEQRRCNVEFVNGREYLAVRLRYPTW